MLEILRMMLVAVIVCIIKNIQIMKLKQKLAIQQTENKSLRRVLFENDLIPEEFVK